MDVGDKLVGWAYRYPLPTGVLMDHFILLKVKEVAGSSEISLLKERTLAWQQAGSVFCAGGWAGTA